MYNNREFKPSFKQKNRSYGSAGNKKFYFSSNVFNQRRGGFKRRTGESIDISKFIKKAVETPENKVVKPTNTFSDFGFVSELEKNLGYKKFLEPTPIQDQSISHVMKGKDLIGLASTGTGKTGVFLWPMINKTFKDKNQKVLIIAPTRELALQIASEFHVFSYGMRIFSALCVGGMPIYKQITNLRRRPQFVIGTPGRLKDMHKRNLINYSQFQNIVLDEVDRMLDMGFVDEIRDILNELPKEKQALFFSATMPPKIRSLSEEFLKNPIVVSINAGETTQNVEQDIIRANDYEKFSKLQEILVKDESKKVLIFSETKKDVEKLTNDLINAGHKATSIHGDKRQGQRQRALTQFKNNEMTILVATDVAARGLDIKNISHVINYTIPQTYDDYIHRIGRTGRGDKKGTALTFVK